MADVPLMSNPMTTAGDIIYGGASGAPTRLGIGTAGQVLKVNSGATALEYGDESGSSGGSALFPLIGDPPAFSGSGDTDFRGAANLGNYTAVGSDGAGTIALKTTTTTTNIYQLTDAGLLIQCGHGEVQEFRADYTLPDGQSMIMAGSFTVRQGAGDNAAFALRLNNSNTSSTTGDFISIMLEQDSTSEFCIQGNSSADAAGKEFDTPQWWISPMWLFRIARDNLTYRSWVSMNGGATWTYVDTETFGSALTDVWISVLGSSANQVHMPVACVPFIVEGHGDDAFHPW